MVFLFCFFYTIATVILVAIGSRYKNYLIREKITATIVCYLFYPKLNKKIVCYLCCLFLIKYGNDTLSIFLYRVHIYIYIHTVLPLMIVVLTKKIKTNDRS